MAFTAIVDAVETNAQAATSFLQIRRVGDKLNGEVVRILEFGAFVKISPNKDGLVHISEIKKERVNKVEDHINIGDMVDVKVIKVDNKSGKVSLSMKSYNSD